MKILFFGDIVGRVGRDAIRRYLPKLVNKYNIDFVIANGENVTHGKGIIEKHYNELIDLGIDCITLGNHYLSKDNIVDFIDDATRIVRPANILKRLGVGTQTFVVNGYVVRVSNILGTAFMKEDVSNPYLSLKEIIDASNDEIHIVDFHAEATGEKMCFGYAFDGLVSAILGTHTHVQTNDARILDNGTGYISDVGMCGAYNGVLGFEKNSVINKILFGNSSVFKLDDNDQMMINAVVLDIDEENKKCREIFPVRIIDNGK